MAETPLLEVRGLAKHFPVRSGLLQRPVGYVHAVEGVDFGLGRRETLGIVGESGCGKSTLARMIVRLLEPSQGSILFDGHDITRLAGERMRQQRRDIQFIFQDPFASLNPRLRAGDIVGEALENYGIARGAELKRRVGELFERVGLRPDQARQLPHEFSGGQRQRLGIARALAVNPSVIVADEPVSALDVSVQAQVINLLADLQDEFGLSYLFIAHDLAVVQHISHRVAVMYLGRIVELAEQRRLFSRPTHPYTEALLDSVPVPDPNSRQERAPLTGEVPSPMNPPSGCPFHTRCPLVEPQCREVTPPLVDIGGGHLVACHVRAPEAAATTPAAEALSAGEHR